MNHDLTAQTSSEVGTEKYLRSVVRVSPQGPLTSPYRPSVRGARNIVLPAYYTPDWLAEDMAGLCIIKPNAKVLEPSAGRGDLALIARRYTQDITCFELNTEACKGLRKDFTTKHCDFLKQKPEPIYNNILMNPPSMDDRYIDHIFHAMKFLAHGGRLVALVVDRFLTGQTEKDNNLRNLVFHRGCMYSIHYPEFHVNGDPVNACLLKLNNQYEDWDEYEVLNKFPVDMR